MGMQMYTGMWPFYSVAFFCTKSLNMGPIFATNLIVANIHVKIVTYGYPFRPILPMLPLKVAPPMGCKWG